jgi:hypothetical protein
MAKSRAVTEILMRRRWTEDDARGVLAALDASGVSVSAFAEREGVDPQRIYMWRRRLPAVTPAAGPAFVELRPGDIPRVEVVLRSGHVLRVPESFDAEALGRLLEVLEAQRSC